MSPHRVALKIKQLDNSQEALGSGSSHLFAVIIIVIILWSNTCNLPLQPFLSVQFSGIKYSHIVIQLLLL